MPRAMLLTTAAFACLVLALGCEGDRKAPDPPRNTTKRTTTTLARPPVQRPVDAAPVSVPKTVEPEPAMTTPPVENVVDTPAFAPKPPPSPAVPRRPPSQYRDGCGRPLVA